MRHHQKQGLLLILIGSYFTVVIEHQFNSSFSCIIGYIYDFVLVLGSERLSPEGVTSRE